MIKNFLFSISWLIALGAAAQKPFYESYNWDVTPDISQYAVNENMDIIAFKENITSEFYFQEQNSLVEYYLEHHLIWLNADEKIEEYNKIYLPYKSNSELLVNKARVIDSKGNIKELDESKILTAQDEETKRSYKYFAMEGLQKGSFIEYFYVVKQYPRYRGKKIVLQNNFEKNNVQFNLYAPKNLIFKFKSFNNLPEVTLDTTETKKLHWTLKLDKVQELNSEEQSAYNASKQYLIYKLDRNNITKVSDISSYDNVSKNIYNNLFAEPSKNEISSIKKLIATTKVNEEKDILSKIRVLENFIKSNFYITSVSGKELENIKSVIANKAGNDTGILKVFIAIMKQLDIKVQVVLTSDRFETKFDDTFEANNFLTDYLLYFPQVKQFTSPTERASRIGFPPSELVDNHGLFIKEVSVGSFKSGIGKIAYINAPQAKQSSDNLKIEVAFNSDDPTITNITFDRSFDGYNAAFVQPFLDFANEEDKNELYNQLIKSINESMTIKKITPFNDKAILFGVKPLRVVAETESNAFVDKAGNKYLFKVGQLIGPQIEMYQEEERKLPVESDHTRGYKRIITVNIPEGYKIANPEAINIHNYSENDTGKTMEFHSFYELENNILKVFANEFYRINRIPVTNFESYRLVINSAADFNKVVLVLEKE